MAFARNDAGRRVGFRLQSPSILGVARIGESATRERTRAGSQSTNKLDVTILSKPWDDGSTIAKWFFGSSSTRPLANHTSISTG